MVCWYIGPFKVSLPEANLLHMARYALSDIHGCHKTFRTALDGIGLNRSDELFLLGDYIDRGPNSAGVLNTIWQLQDEQYSVYCLRGNHEQMLVDHHDGKRDLYEWTPPAAYVQDVVSWINDLPYYLETPGYLLVHAGLNFRHAYPLQDQEAMLWIRYWYDETDLKFLGDRIIVHGHTPQPQFATEADIQQLKFQQRICIDTGCSHSEAGMGVLTALNLDTLEASFYPMAD